jgi:phosphate transport system substrate-binding protein
VKPGVETISDGSYPISRPLYFYVKTAHAKVIPGIRQYLGEFTSGKAWGEEGYLTDRGLIPMPADERKKFADDAKNMTAMSM